MNTINLRGVVAEDFANYKDPSMFLITSYCDFKCCHEGGFAESVCQNQPMIENTSIKDFQIDTILKAYTQNPITKAIVIGGLEPMLQIDEILELVYKLRHEYENYDPVVIYTGYYPTEIEKDLASLKQFDNIIIKFGRYKPNDTPYFNETLGVTLASSNQFAEKIS